MFGENLILLGWYRFVCSNGLVIGESKIEIKERHKQGLELASIGWRLRQALASVEAGTSAGPHDGEGGLSASAFRRLLSQPYRQDLAAAARGWRGAIPAALAR